MTTPFKNADDERFCYRCLEIEMTLRGQASFMAAVRKVAETKGKEPDAIISRIVVYQALGGGPPDVESLFKPVKDMPNFVGILSDKDMLNVSRYVADFKPEE